MELTNEWDDERYPINAMGLTLKLVVAAGFPCLTCQVYFLRYGGHRAISFGRRVSVETMGKRISCKHVLGVEKEPG